MLVEEQQPQQLKRPHENGYHQNNETPFIGENGHATGEIEKEKEKETEGIQKERNEQSFHYLQKVLGGPKHFLAPMVGRHFIFTSSYLCLISRSI